MEKDDKYITHGKITQDSQSNVALLVDMAAMFRATKFVIYRNRSQMINDFTADSFFTSRTKAVDALRKYAEEIPEAVQSYRDYEEGKRFSYKDVFVSLWIYKEREGRLVRAASRSYMQVMDGALQDNSGDMVFETF